jgi:hypothetical protein
VAVFGALRRALRRERRLRGAHVPGEEQAATVTDNPSSLLGIPGDDQLTIDDDL